MVNCKEITRLATEHAEGALDPSAARAFEQHVAGCDGCRAWVRQLEAARGAVQRLPSPEPSAELTASLMRRFDDWQAARAPAVVTGSPALETSARAAGPAALVLLAAVAGLVALARHPSHEPGDWLVAAGLVTASVGVAALVRRLTIGFAATAASAALFAALLRGSEGQLSALGGLECLLVEAAVAGGAAAFAWRLFRRGPDSVRRSSVGVWATAGALAGDAALQVSCAQHDSLPHLLVFHLGGLLFMVAASWFLTGHRVEAT